VIFGVAANVSITKLFLAGIVPGLADRRLALGDLVVAQPARADRGAGAEVARRMLKALRESAWAMGLPFIILVGLRFGVFTPTEAAVVAAVYALFVATVVYRELKLSQISACSSAPPRSLRSSCSWSRRRWCRPG